MSTELPKTQSDVLESLTTMIENAGHPLMDDGRVGEPLPGMPVDVIPLYLRDGSTWYVSATCRTPGHPIEVDD